MPTTTTTILPVEEHPPHEDDDDYNNNNNNNKNSRGPKSDNNHDPNEDTIVVVVRNTAGMGKGDNNTASLLPKQQQSFVPSSKTSCDVVDDDYGENTNSNLNDDHYESMMNENNNVAVHFNIDTDGDDDDRKPAAVPTTTTMINDFSNDERNANYRNNGDDNSSTIDVEKGEEEEKKSDNTYVDDAGNNSTTSTLLVAVGATHNTVVAAPNTDATLQSPPSSSSTTATTTTTTTNDVAVITDEDGRPLSEYEMLRLERMKRNHEYLLQLGLADTESHNKPKKKRMRATTSSSSTSTTNTTTSSTNEEAVVERRSSLNRSTKIKPRGYYDYDAKLKALTVGKRSILSTATTMMKTTTSASASSVLQPIPQLPSEQPTTATATATTTVLTTGISVNEITMASAMSSSSSSSSSAVEMPKPTNGVSFSTATTSSSQTATTAVASTDNNNNANDNAIATIQNGLEIPYKKGNRMEIFIYKEFRRLRSMKRNILLKVERLIRLIEKEVKYWSNQQLIYNRKRQRTNLLASSSTSTSMQLQQQQLLPTHLQRQQQDQLYQQQMIRTKRKEILREMDAKMPCIKQVIQQYDQNILEREQKYERDVKIWETNERIRTADAHEWYPKALQNACSKLDSILIQTAPIDPPAPRRSLRSITDNDENTKATPKKMKRTTKSQNTSTVEVPAAKETSIPRIKLTRKKVVLVQTDDTITDESRHFDNNDNMTTTSMSNLDVHLISQSPSENDTCDDDNNVNSNKSKVVKQKQRHAKNVGGWISPDFANNIDRTWLQSQVPTFGGMSTQQQQHQQELDLASYVPQIGDIVLYYISGHKKYLHQYPDILAKKSRIKLRVPLWERAKQLSESINQTNETSTTSSMDWWNDEWIDGLENSNLGDYPIICRVERTHAEFPHDPSRKVVESDKGNDGVIVSFKKPKKLVVGEGKTAMRLAVLLRPLSPVMAPPVTFCCDEVSLPPTFTVITFPCELEPFLIPFTWGYMKSHSISLKQKVQLSNNMNFIVRVEAFVTLKNRDTMQLDDRRKEMDILLSQDRCEIENELKKEELIIPFRDVRTILDLWYRNGKASNSDASAANDGTPSPTLSDIFSYVLRSTLPLWHNVVRSKKTSHDLDKPKISGWYLSQLSKGKNFNVLATGFLNRLDDSLRLKLERAMQTILESDFEANDLFFHPITEEDAPSYNCAVPVSMSFSTVMHRLRVHAGYISCYYRSFESLLSDIGSILDCCLLYNSPEAEIVDIATSVVGNAREVLLNVFKEHYRSLKSTRSKESENQLLIHQPRPWFHNIGRKPRNVTINRAWMDLKLPTVSSPVNPSTETITYNTYQVPFQVGDSVIYSRSAHASFIAGHRSSLDYNQCHVIPANSEIEEDDDLVHGKVVRTHAAFPKYLTRDEKDSFQAPAILQCLGIMCNKSNDVFSIFWRPCILDAGASNSDTVCTECGLAAPFVRLTTIETYDNDHCCMVSDQVEAISRYFDVIKRRCINGIDPGKVSKSTVAGTNKLIVSKVGKHSLPSYENLLRSGSTQSIDVHNGTRRVALKPKEDDYSVPNLVDTGYIPRWITAARGGTIDEPLLRKLDVFLPLTHLSLESISAKLRNGFYRYKEAIENDVVEAYINAIYSLLFEALTRKKSTISVKRIALLASHDKNSPDKIDMNSEEQELVDRIQRIRSLYGLALLSVGDITRTHRIFIGLSSDPPKRVDDMRSAEEQSRYAARNELAYLAVILRRENHTLMTGDDRRRVLPKLKLNVFLSKDDSMGPLQAKIGNASSRVNIICAGKTVTYSALLHPINHKIPTHTFSFEPDDYLQNDELCSFLFSKPGASSVCARCQVYNRSMATCRVIRKHTNPDFDWSTLFTDGVGFVDDLIRTVDPAAVTSIDESHNIENDTALKEKQSCQVEIPLAGQAPFDGTVAAEENLRPEEKPPEKSLPTLPVKEAVDDNDVDPSEFLKTATALSTLATEMLEAAKIFLACPLRLSKSFIKSSYPVDKSDGHFLYCVVCGLSGDLLCCDGCPNVVHADCISLIDLPEGDWFCEECVAKKSVNGNFGDTSQVSTATVPFGHSIRSSICTYEAFGRVSFDENKLDYLSVEIDKLRKLRTTEKAKEVSAAEDNPIKCVTSKDTIDVVDDVRPHTQEVSSINAHGREQLNSQGKVFADASSNGLIQRKRGRPPLNLDSNTSSGDELNHPTTIHKSTSCSNHKEVGSKVIEFELSHCPSLHLVQKTRRGTLRYTNVPTVNSRIEKSVQVDQLVTANASKKRSLPGSPELRVSTRPRIVTERLVDLPIISGKKYSKGK